MRVTLLLLTCLLCACTPSPEEHPVLQPVRQGGELVVATRAGPTTFFEDGTGGYAGLEHDLAEAFAAELGARVKFILADGPAAALELVAGGRAHLAATGSAYRPGTGVRFGEPYHAVNPVLVIGSETFQPRTLEDLVGRTIAIPQNSHLLSILAEAKRSVPRLSWIEVPDLGPYNLLERVAAGRYDATVVESDLFAVARNFHPNLSTVLDMGKSRPLAWGFAADGDRLVLDRAAAFFKRIAHDGTLARLIDRYYGHVRRLTSADLEAFLQSMRTTLPRFRAYFQRAEERTGIDWRLVAALAYQESHWDANATSPTKVRGLLMLTENTADRLGLDDRLDPEQSALAGGRYLLELRDALPPRIAEPDRTWIALAAYNLGLGHLERGRVLAQKLKLNPDNWLSLRRALPMMGRSEHWRGTGGPPPRGGEAVIMVENVRTYYDVLRRFQPAYSAPFPLLQSLTRPPRNSLRGLAPRRDEEVPPAPAR